MEIVSFAVGIAGLLAAVFFGYRLWRWEQAVGGFRIVVAYKRKVKLEAPFVDWLKWGNMLRGDQQAGGRVVYHHGGTSVVVVKPRPRPTTKTRTIKEGQST